MIQCVVLSQAIEPIAWQLIDDFGPVFFEFENEYARAIKQCNVFAVGRDGVPLAYCQAGVGVVQLREFFPVETVGFRPLGFVNEIRQTQESVVGQKTKVFLAGGR